MKTRRRKAIIRRILKIEEKIKALYKTKDALTNELIGAVPLGEIIEVEGKEFIVKDNFAEKS